MEEDRLNRNLLVYSFDPGKKTGWAFYKPFYPDSFKSGEDELFNVMNQASTWLRTPGYDVVCVCEDFIFTTATAKKSRQTFSTEGIGVLRFFSTLYGRKFVLQRPGEAKKLVTNARLKHMGWYSKGSDGHDNDAARHLLLYLLRGKIIPLSQFVGDHDVSQA